MQGDLDHPPIIVRGARWRGAVVFVGSTVVVAAILFGLGTGHGTKTLLASLVFFSVLGVAGLWMAVAPARLEIGPEGLRQTQLWRRSRYPWSDVHDFRPATLGFFNRVVGFDFLVAQPKRAGIRRLNAAIVGVHATLQPGWEIDPHTLANLLNQARERWLAFDPAGGPAPAPAIAPPPVARGFAGARMDRKVFALCVVAGFAVAVGLSFIPGANRGASSVATVIFIRLYASRLHDIGRSGWWQVLLYAAQILAGILLATAAGWDLEMVVAAVLALQLIFTGLLAAIPGQVGPNRFGPAPGQPTAVGQSEAFR